MAGKNMAVKENGGIVGRDSTITVADG
jgi:hypothetical protein